MDTVKNNKGKIIILIFIGLVLIGKHFTDQIGEKNLQDIFRSEYKGLVLKKFRRRGNIILCKNLVTNKSTEIYATRILNKNSSIGDTIIKIANSNLCIIKNKRKNIKMKCYELDFK
ncbi:hypothetical protein [Flavobacterium pectinovorum]|uniref:Uncharacterized protein n=1 Tax=Flavobacterium pectinovorum TaxID=29533 RepID=A0A502EX28_9FLAO|nr:hypothetical protein [Flavobacterium pectinovorum]TPG41672.1 hypothetical protein EAH81_09330 [Flavobacterium pectinovorum]